MKLSSEEFFALTPRLFLELRDVWLDEQREMQSLVGLLRRDVINSGIARPEEAARLEQLDWPVLKKPGEVKSQAPAAPRRRMTMARRREVDRQWRRFFKVNN